MIRYERLGREASGQRLRAAGRLHARRKHRPQMTCRLIFTCTINTPGIRCWLCSVPGALRGSRAGEPFVLCNPADVAFNSQNLQTVAAFKVFADPGCKKCRFWLQQVLNLKSNKGKHLWLLTLYSLVKLATLEISILTNAHVEISPGSSCNKQKLVKSSRPTGRFYQKT